MTRKAWTGFNIPLALRAVLSHLIFGILVSQIVIFARSAVYLSGSQFMYATQKRWNSQLFNDVPQIRHIR